MRTEQERAQLRSIVSSPQWQAVVVLAEELCIKAKTEQTTYETQWDTIRDSLISEGQVRGIKNLLQSIQREAFQPENDQ